MTEFNAIRTASGMGHYLMNEGTVCNPAKLPKGEKFVAGTEATYEFQGQTHTYTQRVLCKRCIKNSPWGF